MPAGTLRDLYESELLDLYAAEHQIISALPEMANAAQSADLKAALERHLERTRIHAERLDFLFKQSGIATRAGQSSGLEAAVRTGAARIREQTDPDVRDAAIISVAQHVEHYEMAGYGCARTFARQLGDDRAADLLQQTLDEEGDADKKLTSIAESGVNQAASAGDLRATDTGRDRMHSRMRYVDLDNVSDRDTYRDLKVRNRSGDDLGKIDGFIVDASGRPYYLVVNVGGLFGGGRHVVPIGRTALNRGERVLTVDLDKDTLKRYPDFHDDEFGAMSDDEARRYEWRVLEAVDPQAARSTTTRNWDYEQFAYYKRPEWFGSDIVPPKPSRTARTTTGRTTREVPISAEEEERERVLAREDVTPEEPPNRERTRGRSDEIG